MMSGKEKREGDSLSLKETARNDGLHCRSLKLFQHHVSTSGCFVVRVGCRVEHVASRWQHYHSLVEAL